MYYCNLQKTNNVVKKKKLVTTNRDMNKKTINKKKT